MEINYCILSYKNKNANRVLFIVHDAISSYFEYIKTVASLMTEDLKIVLFNYPGQAYTTFGNRKLTGV